MYWSELAQMTLRVFVNIVTNVIVSEAFPHLGCYAA